MSHGCEQCKKEEKDRARAVVAKTVLGVFGVGLTVFGGSFLLLSNPDDVGSFFNTLFGRDSTFDQFADSVADPTFIENAKQFSLSSLHVITFLCLGLGGAYLAARHMTKPKPASVFVPSYKRDEHNKPIIDD